MYNGIRKGHNRKLLLLLQLSTNADKMGIMCNNTRIISDIWLCGFNWLERNFVERQSHEIATRVSLIKDLTTCEIPGLILSTFVLLHVDFTNYVLVCILPHYVLTTVNVILLTIFHGLYPEYEINIYIMW